MASSTPPSVCNAHSVPVAEGTADVLCVDRFEVSVGRYQECVSARACETNDGTVFGPEFEGTEAFWERFCTSRMGRADLPLNCVDWQAARRFCEWAGGRLPSMREWLLVAGTSAPEAGRANVCDRSCRAMFVSLGRPGEYVDIDDGFESISPVGALDHGTTVEVHDLAGNLGEWTEDAFEPSRNDQRPDQRTVLGSSWETVSEEYVSGTTPYGHLAEGRGESLGFRCVYARRSP
ncbi:MAG: SUMF1/EgtB/PvdO family nonheme iron enzyme [Deltaproteobacteria bacterium]|nr:SUMF1/EgtB/PvdO family nonheme iron enzyme [Deltaproteobacteria bacterium]